MIRIVSVKEKHAICDVCGKDTGKAHYTVIDNKYHFCDVDKGTEADLVSRLANSKYFDLADLLIAKMCSSKSKKK